MDAAGFIGCWTYDARSDAVIADSKITDLFSINSDPINGDSLNLYCAAIHPSDRDNFLATVLLSAQNGGAFSARYRVLTSNGARWVLGCGLYKLDECGRPFRGHGILLDVTSHHRDHAGSSSLAKLDETSGDIEDYLDELAGHLIAASEIARALPFPRLQAMTDPLLWETGRLLAWATTKV